MAEPTYGELLRNAVEASPRPRTAIALVSQARGGPAADSYIRQMEFGLKPPPPVHAVIVLADVLHADVAKMLRASIGERYVAELGRAKVQGGNPMREAQLRAAALLAEMWGKLSDEELGRLVKLLHEGRR